MESFFRTAKDPRWADMFQPPKGNSATNETYQKWLANNTKRPSFFMDIGGVREFVPCLTESDKLLYLARRFKSTKDLKYLEAINELLCPRHTMSASARCL